MKISTRASALAIATAIGTAGLVMPATTVGAALKPSVACSRVDATPIKNGKLASSYSVCTPAALKAGGNALSAVSKTGPTKGKLINTITWKNGKGTTKTSITYAGTTPGKCKAPYKRVKLGGKVISSTGVAKTIIKVGEPLSGFVCSIQSGPKTGQTHIEPGTKFKL